MYIHVSYMLQPHAIIIWFSISWQDVHTYTYTMSWTCTWPCSQSARLWMHTTHIHYYNRHALCTSFSTALLLFTWIMTCIQCEMLKFGTSVWQWKLKRVETLHYLHDTSSNSIHLLLGVVEGLSWCNSCDDLLGQLFLSLVPRCFGKLLLLIAVVENGRHVLPGGAASWIVVLPEQLQHFSIGRLLGVKVYLHGFRVITTEGELVAKTVKNCAIFLSCSSFLGLLSLIFYMLKEFSLLNIKEMFSM